MSARPSYEFKYKTTSTDSNVAALAQDVYWYDTGETSKGSPIYQDSTDTYAIYKEVSRWTIGLAAEIGNSPTDYYDGTTTIGDDLDGVGTWTGTITWSVYSISGAWDDAEREVFDSLVSYVGGTENSNAFRGRYPTNEDGEPAYRNIWMINSGGAAGAFDPERTYGTNGNWCNVLIDAEIRGLFETRVMAMNFASSVLAWLKHTNNMNQTGNVTWFMLTDLPQPPEPIIIGHSLQWEVVIPTQMLYLTESTH